MGKDLVGDTTLGTAILCIFGNAWIMGAISCIEMSEINGELGEYQEGWANTGFVVHRIQTKKFNCFKQAGPAAVRSLLISPTVNPSRGSLIIYHPKTGLCTFPKHWQI